MTVFRSLFRLLPLLGLLLLAAQPASAMATAQGNPVVAQHERHALPSALGGLATGTQHAASLEEYSAIDDDPEQNTNALARWASPYARYTLVAERQPPRYRAPLPTHPPRAFPPTGPPRA